MLLIACPHCGPRNHREFAYGGDANSRRPPESGGEQDWFEFVYMRDNPRGPHRELWQHVQGCRAWIVVTRDTATHEIGDTSLPNGPGNSGR